MTTKGGPNLIHPRCYMYAILAYIWLELMVHVAKYSIHGAYGRGYQPLMAPWVSTFDRGHGTEKKKPRRLDLLKIQKKITRRCFFFRERSQSLPPGVSSVFGVNGSWRPLCSMLLETGPCAPLQATMMGMQSAPVKPEKGLVT